MIRILAAIVVPPHLSVSGGAKAGEALSETLASSCDVTVASMLRSGPLSGAPDRAGAVRRALVTTWLPFGLASAPLPNRYKTLFYRSDIDRIVQEGRYDLVHLHNPMPTLEMRRIARACRRAAIPYVISAHGFNEVVNGEKIYGFGEARRTIWQALVVRPLAEVVRGAARIFALSPADIDLIRRLGHEAGNISVVGNGVDLPPAETNDGGDAEILRHLSIDPPGPERPPTCLFLANHTPNKGLPILLESFRSLAAPYQLVVAGETRPGIPYGTYVNACGPSQRIVVTDRLTDRQLMAVFRRAELFVFPTLADTFPLVVLEAMAHGLPVVASRVGGIPHQLEGGAGLTVEPGNSAALASAVLALLRDPSRRAAMGRQAKAKAAAEFTWDRAAEAALDGYRQALADARSPARPRDHPLGRGVAGQSI